jgi:hypothetical protein
MAPSLTERPSWRKLLLVSIGLPLLIMLAVLSFAWPAARVAPRDLPLGIVNSTDTGRQVATSLEHTEPGAFDLTLYSDQATAVRAIEDRDVYGALMISPHNVTVMTASAASPTVAQLLAQVGQRLANQLVAPTQALGTRPAVTSIDVVAISPHDPRGLVLSSVLLPLTICSIMIAAVTAGVLKLRPAWRQVLALVTVSALAGLGVYIVAQGFLGALPHQRAATWAAISLTMLAMSATTAALIALFGSFGMSLGGVLMLYVGNPFSGVTSAPELLPRAVSDIGKWLPPGAGANLLRSTAYFNGNGAAPHVTTLVVWTAAGILGIALGHHTILGKAYRRARRDDRSPTGLRSQQRQASVLHPEPAGSVGQWDHA